MSTADTYISRFVHDSYGNMTSFTDAMDNTTFFVSDTQYLAHLPSISSALNNVVTAAYDLSTGRGFFGLSREGRGNLWKKHRNSINAVAQELYEKFLDFREGRKR